ncbi:enoyl-CoA hydratase-related protein [Brevibacillus choshinensis]|uniref:enoyl-CoA hydratase-related protein n=1 Tax=Brevibacillus choshinensis TaxID=54911 RepID=UPI002E1E7FE1|nr:enoyl-CoA hydratase-related protein [Brevibacillus choshinensis]MED4584603.1 enoyl-CoA hydratase-related protein [Brevibacillus choshinensis]MED4753244.1 enoyl-CoA hydratase-related protein [Brevibacillus choshinensis]MED4782329.1 enoyl-CoA hydratase-related protein [Brevibacillus choshinensis]
MDFVTLEVKDYIGIVTVNRPPVNAVNAQLYKEIADTFRSINEMDDVRVVVFRAEGEKAFLAGNDLNEFLTMTPENADERMRKVRESFWSVYDCKVPVIGAINGIAPGTGLAYASVCDIIIASENATFSLPEINVGVMGGAKHLSRLVPQMVVRYMHYTGKPMTAAEMKEYGAVLKVVPKEELLDAAMIVASEISKKSPIAIKLAKQSLNTIEYMDLKEGYTYEQSLSRELSGYEDSKEAVNAFFEKREPVFKGK